MDPDQKKRLIVVVVAAVAIVFLWKMMFSGPDYEAALASDSKAERLRAIEELERMDSASAAELISKYVNDDDLVIAQRVIISMGRMKKQVPVEDLVPLLDSPKAAIREAAVIAVGSRGREGDPARLRDVMMTDKEVGVRMAAIAELSSMRDWEATELFAQLLSHDDPMLVSTAADAIMRIGGIQLQGFRSNATPAQRASAIRFLQQNWRSFKFNHDEYQHYLEVKRNNQ